MKESSIKKSPTFAPSGVEEGAFVSKRAWQPYIVWGMLVLLLVIDQVIKLWVKQNMVLGDKIKVFDWFYIYFVENPGMAFGLELGSKLFLTLFRIVAMAGICWGLARLMRKRLFTTGFLVTVGLIAAGGIGNIIDCLFYGLIFSGSEGQLATLFPSGGGYAPFLHGKVVDMFYFPLIDCTLPEGLPFFGGKRFTFFDPIFNFADSCISVGVAIMLLFYSRSFSLAVDYLFKKKPKMDSSHTDDDAKE